MVAKNLIHSPTMKRNTSGITWVVLWAGCLFNIVVLGGCDRKTPTETQEEKAIQKHQMELEQMQRRQATNMERLKSVARLPAASSTAEALVVGSRLLAAGKLPGATNGMALIAEGALAKISTNYPWSRTFRLYRGKEEQFLYHYTLVKESPEASWKLDRAWKTDTRGNTIEEFSLR